MRLSLRILCLILPVTLGSASLDWAGVPGYATPPSVACAHADAMGAAPTSSLARADHHAVEALVARPGPMFDQLRDDSGGAKRRVGSQSTRFGVAGDTGLEAQARAASRARHVARTSLAFAADLARARAGIVLPRSAAPPPAPLG